MDGQAFDRIARALGAGMRATSTRRAGLLGALGGMLGVAGAVEAGSGKHGRGPAAEGPCGPTKKDNVCTKNKDCCTGYCETKKTTNLDGKGRCRCLSSGMTCTKRQTCCGRLSCLSGICGHPPPPTPCMVCASGCAYATVQAAIDAAAPGDAIDIGGGVYSEDLTIDKNLVLQACHGESVTLQNLTDATRTIVLSNTPTVRITGITVTCGTCVTGSGGGISGLANLTLDGSASVTGNANSGNGGGILMEAELLTGDYVLAMVDTASISDNSADSYGGGLYFGKTTGGASTFTVTMDDDASITGNVSSGGAGMKLYREGRVVMRGNSRIDGNEVKHLVDSYDGGAIAFVYIEAPAGTTIFEMHDSSKITNNIADDAGGAVNVTRPGNAVLMVMDGTSEVSGNSAGGDGGGFSIYAALTPTSLTVKDTAVIRNNTATGNGGGVLLGGDAALVLQGSASVTGNTAASGGGVYSVLTGTSVTGGSAVTSNTPDQCAGTGISC
ncbi:MAG: hypothetical protein ACR2J8_01600 [Thermomicrobiales bacterium]